MFDCHRRLMEIYYASRVNWSIIERDPRLIPKLNDVSRPEFQLPSNQAERLAREILREIRLLGWQPGVRIGGGPELMKRYAVSTNILRQAVRMLEEHSAVEVARGRNGGLYIATPKRQRAVDRAIDYLSRCSRNTADVRSLLVQIILQGLDRAPAFAASHLRKALGVDGFVSFPNLCRAVANGVGEPAKIFTDIFLALLPDEPASRISNSLVLRIVASRDAIQIRRLLLTVAAGKSGETPNV
jgi:hypothetical protein